MTPNPTPENPPAFPVSNEANVNGQPGMLLRDWFAGHALAGMLASKIGHEITNEKLAVWGYELADAMLRAREVTK